eukprot:jgi/Chlat1/726/Chrsp104S01297
MVLSGAAQAAWSLVYVAAVVGVAVVLSVSKGLATRVITGLQSYHVASPDDGEAVAGSKGAPSHQQPQQKKKGDSSQNLQLVVSDVTSTAVRTNRFYISYEQVMFFAVCSIIHFVASEVLRRLGLPITDHGSYLVLGAVSSVLNSTTCPPLEKTVAVIAGVASAAFAAAALWLLPASFVHFDIDTGAAELFPAMQAYLKANRDLDLTLPSIPPAAIKLLLTAAAAAIGGLLAAPALRSMRCYHLATEPPAIFDSAAAVSVAGPFARLALHVAVAMPMLCTTLWIKPLWSPLIQYRATGGLPWRLSPSQFDDFRMWALVACGLEGVLTLRLLLRAYLQSAIVQWFELRHQDAQAVSHNLLYAKVELTNLLFCKVAVQLISGPLLVLLFAGLLRGKLLSHASSDELPGSFIIPPSLWRATLSFLAWWTCAAWTAMTATVLALYRFGFLH